MCLAYSYLRETALANKDNIAELCAHKPTVSSVLSRLVRYEKDIKHISCVITWKDDDSTQFSGDSKDLSEIALHSAALQAELTEMLLSTKERIE